MIALKYKLYSAKIAGAHLRTGQFWTLPASENGTGEYT